ncbi:Uncharacterized protein DBV15_12564, partial [Temnothorax longispinosus]
LLKRCFRGFIQNNNESFNALVWKYAPKNTSGKAKIAEMHMMGSYLAAIQFNEGYTGLLEVLEVLKIKFGQQVTEYRDKQNALRISAAEQKPKATTRDTRFQQRHTLNEQRGC